MVTNKLHQENARKSTLRKRSQKSAIDDEDRLTKRSRLSDELMNEKKTPEEAIPGGERLPRAQDQ